MRSRGIDISGLRARRITAADFERFDMILAMDRANRQGLYKLAPKERQSKIAMLMDFAPNLTVQDIPDPFFGDRGAFDFAWQLIDAACRGLLVSLTAQPQQQAPVQATPASRPLAPLNG